MARLGVFVDAPFHRDAGGGLSVHPDAYSFLLFVRAVGDHFTELTVFGREVDRPDGLVPLPDSTGVRLWGLPGYDSLRDVGRVARVTVPTARALWRGLRHVDVLWAMGPHPFGVLGGLLAAARRRRVVLGVRQETREYFRARVPGRFSPMLAVLGGLETAYRLLGRVWRVTAVGSAVAGRYGAPRPDVLETVVALVGRGGRRDVDRADRPLAPVRLLTVGRIAVDKNPFLLVEAMAGLQARSPGRYRLLWVGDGPLAAETRCRVDAAGLADVISFAGFVPFGPDLLERYAAADLFVHVALTEGVPQVLLEAAALRLPIVATDVGGVRAALDDGRCALLVPPGDAAALGAAVERLGADPVLRRSLVGEAARRFADRTLEGESGRVAGFLLGRS